MIVPSLKKSEGDVKQAQTSLSRARELRVLYEQTFLLEHVEACVLALQDACAIFSSSGGKADSCDTSAVTKATPQSTPTDRCDAAPKHVSAPRASTETITFLSFDVLWCYLEFSIALGDRYKHNGDLNDINQQVQLLHSISFVDVASGDSQLFVRLQCELGAALRSRFMHTGNMDDLDEAHKLHASLVDQSSTSHRALALYNLGATLFVYHSRFGDNEIISHSIGLSEEALQLFPTNHPCRYSAQYFWAMAYWMKGRLTGDMTHVHAAVATYHSIIASQHPNHPDYWLPYNGLSSCMCVLHQETGDPTKLDEAVEYGRRAFHMLNPNSPNRVRPAINLVLALHRRYKFRNHVEDLEEGIQLGMLCLHFEHALTPHLAQRVALLLQDRYYQYGDAFDLDQSIKLLRHATSAFPEGHLLRSDHLHTLAHALVGRFSKDGHLPDLQESIEYFRETACPFTQGKSHRDLEGCLASALRKYYQACGDISSLEQAIMLYERFPACYSGCSMIRRIHLARGYAKSLRLRFQHHGRVGDVDAAVARYQEALTWQGPEHVMRDCILDFAETLRLKFTVLQDSADACCAERHLNTALATFPVGHFRHAAALFELAKLRLMRSQSLPNVLMSLENIKQALSQGYQYPEARLAGIRKVFELLFLLPSTLFRSEPHLQQELLDIHKLTMNLLPRIACFGLGLPSRLRVLVGQPTVAIELLEQGRAVFWSQHLQLRTAFEGLPTDLAEELRHTAALLERGSRAAAFFGHGEETRASPARDIEAADLRKLGDQFEALVARARALPGLQNFMLPSTFSTLAIAAARGPVVVLLANNAGCQAVIIKENRSAQQVYLPGVSADSLQDISQHVLLATRLGRGALRSRAMKYIGLRRGRKLEEALETLWCRVMVKIVAALELDQKTEARAPRVTLCATGILAHLPLHAAGIYPKDRLAATQCVSDFMVLSYTPTLGVLLKARRDLPAILHTAHSKLLVAAVSRSFKWKALPCVADEATQVRRAVPSQIAIDLLSDVQCPAIPSGTAPTCEAVLKRLPEAAILHLACHGYQDPESPLQSGFLMQDAMLTVSELMSLQLEKAFFAFLSACDTAKGDKTQPDQAIHLAATLLFTGFKSVVGTMWAMDDVDGPVVAQAVYKALYLNGAVLDTDAIPYALDEAVRQLRTSGRSPARWAPYVHLGV